MDIKKALFITIPIALLLTVAVVVAIVVNQHGDKRMRTSSFEAASYRTLNLNTKNSLDDIVWDAALGTDELRLDHTSSIDVQKDALNSEITVNGNGKVLRAIIPVQAIKSLCVSQVCMLLLCDLNSGSAMNKEYSLIPANNRILFEDNFCTIKEPKCWQKWIDHYFDGAANYTDDVDGDGLVNIVEYYGTHLFEMSFIRYKNGSLDPPSHNITVDFEKCDQGSRVKRSISFSFGTDPTVPDSDRDLLLDGFESYNMLDPNKKDDISDDHDNDGLDNLSEQIHKTDPRNSDTDGDGMSDKEEIDKGRDPTNPKDKNDPPKPKPDENGQLARVKVTVGDPSGSHSERYILHVGAISHQSPGYGLVGSGTYNFKPGTYPITIQHYGTNLETPDYDYLAQVEKVGGGAKVSVKDPQGILGDHGESSYFYAAGKSAKLVVEADCQTNKCQDQDECAVCSDGSMADDFKLQIEVHEGYRDEIYLDSEGLPTFGVGHLIRKTDPEYGEEVGTKVEKARIDAVFEKDLSSHIADARKFLPDFNEQPDFVQAVVADMAFNMGYNRLNNFKKFKAAIEAKDYSKAADEMVDSVWYGQVGRRGEKLVEMMRNKNPNTGYTKDDIAH